MVRANGLLALILALASPGHAAQLWASWDLDLGTHAPPTHFLLSVTSPTGTPVPHPMIVPWGSCTQVPGAQHCAPIGCPPTGTYDFLVQAQYAEGLSAPTNTARCTIRNNQCVCSDVPPPAQPQAPPLPVVSMPPRPRPPQVQRPQIPPGLVLLPAGEIPPTATVPPIPASAGA